MTRQLATMVSSGMTLLRAFYVLEGQTETNKLKETIVEVRKDIEAGLHVLRGPRRATRRCSRRSTWPWSGRGRRAACSRRP